MTTLTGQINGRRARTVTIVGAGWMDGPRGYLGGRLPEPKRASVAKAGMTSGAAMVVGIARYEVDQKQSRKTRRALSCRTVKAAHKSQRKPQARKSRSKCSLLPSTWQAFNAVGRCKTSG
ncbi:hypothetical protein IAQ61_001794 [Plenodomus lingam]|uniref:uncharacterized protein n=1 Tax=Leptosphaeria maculans TaxID=5022 RepID=UPI0033259EAB|nr:hypothetical protein IAQ61_001794 [Plenodomus lingam]